MDSDSSTIEHQDSLLSHFVSKLNEYLTRTKFGILHPKHHLSNKVDELYLRYQILLCFEIRVKIYGLNFLDEMENVQLRHYVDFCKIIISIIRMLLDLPITNTNDTFLVKLIPSLKLANNYSRMEDDSGKKMVRKLLEHITNRSDILLKKAESSHIDPEIIEFCCITLTLIKDSPFSTALCSIAKDMCYSLPNCSNNNSVYVKKILTTIKSDSKECPRDVFVVERAELIYNICWFTWKCCMSKSGSNIFLDIIHVKDSVSWLMQAYVLCREVPGLLQKRGTSFVDGIVPDIRTFLQKDAQTEGSYSASVSEKRWKIDVHLKELLRNLEDSWLGSWRCLL
ncbi:unnamed protein product [Vicia faba]|uniref:Uncharacterized protein n=1 Tax=Vicia faba TaxID=3906 RepID=A0AAV1BED9_VICFA|nr:unnamed protein product [Vicia faba]